MPQPVESTIINTDVRKGDRVFDKFTGLGSDQDTTVYEIKRGNKYLTIVNANQEILSRREFGDKVSIERMVPTEEEIVEKETQRKIDEREYNNDQIGKWVIGRINGYAERVLKNAQHLIDFPGQNYYSPYDNLLVDGAATLIAKRIQYIKNNSSDSPDWVTAYGLWSEDAKKAILNGYGSWGRALSRSSSVSSNLIEDVAREVTVKILAALEFGRFYLSM